MRTDASLSVSWFKKKSSISSSRKKINKRKTKHSINVRRAATVETFFFLSCTSQQAYSDEEATNLTLPDNVRARLLLGVIHDIKQKSFWIKLIHISPSLLPKLKLIVHTWHFVVHKHSPDPLRRFSSTSSEKLNIVQLFQLLQRQLILAGLRLIHIHKNELMIQNIQVNKILSSQYLL